MKNTNRYLFLGCILTLFCLVNQGCLSASYTLSQKELIRQAYLPPEERGLAIQVSQNINDCDTPNCSKSTRSTNPKATVLIAPAAIYSNTPPSTPLHQKSSSVISPVPTSPRSSRVVTPGPSRTVAPNPSRIVSSTPQPSRTVSNTSKSAPSTTNSKTSSKNSTASSILGELFAPILAAIVLAPITYLVVESSRFDGWLEIPEDEMLYLRFKNQTNEWPIPLYALTPELAYQAKEATLYEGEEKTRFFRIQRAPLHRDGFGLSLSFSTSGLTTPEGTNRIGYGIHSFFGWGITSQLLLGLSNDFKWTSHETSSIFHWNIGPELRYFPIVWAGLYLGAAYAYRVVDDGYNNSGSVFRAGALFELPITSRSALQLRVGALRSFFGDPRSPISFEASLGFAVF